LTPVDTETHGGVTYRAHPVTRANGTAGVVETFEAGGRWWSSSGTVDLDAATEAEVIAAVLAREGWRLTRGGAALRRQLRRERARGLR
jgi:hypothetical protein